MSHSPPELESDRRYYNNKGWSLDLLSDDFKLLAPQRISTMCMYLASQSSPALNKVVFPLLTDTLQPYKLLLESFEGDALSTSVV